MSTTTTSLFCSADAVPKWAPEWSLPRSTLFMPCNASGFTDPNLAAKFGVADFDWSNAKLEWANQSPMDCQERLVTQAELVKQASKNSTKCFVYRNLVKALPWYTQVREKMVDPLYAGWFLKFKESGGPYAVPKCTTDASGEKCSDFYHDQEQTPQPPRGSAQPSRTKIGSWYVYNNTNDVSGCHVGWKTIIDGGGQPNWQACAHAAEIHGRKMFTFWPPDSAAAAILNGTGNNNNDDDNYPALPQQDGAAHSNGTCWLLSDWHTINPQNQTMPHAERAHVSGYRPAAGETPPDVMPSTELCASGTCDCGKGLPCGEYLWDHRNQSLRSWLIDEFIGSSQYGLGNPNVDGFYFDDGWTRHANPVPNWAPPTYRQCDMAPGGGATEEDYNCTKDMGLSPADVAQIYGNWSATMSAVFDAVIARNGFAFQMFSSRSSSIDLHDPRPKCAEYLRAQCKAGGGPLQNKSLLFEFTRKKFHDPFPLPFITQDVAMFLLVRGPYAWIGHSWMGCNTGEVADVVRPAAVDVDYGKPVDAYCAETAKGSGVFKRRWEKADVEMDCNTWKATITPNR
eukprot:UC1_evm1s1043